MYKRYVELRDLAKVKDAEVARETGIAQSTFSDWKSGRSEPKREKLQKIAEFFGVAITYFTEPEQSHREPQDALSDQERELLHLFRKLAPEGRRAALNAVRYFQTVPEYIKADTGEKVG